MQELFVDKIHFFKFLSMSGKPRRHQLNITSSRSTVQASLTVWMFSSIPTRKGKYRILRANTKPHQLIKHAKISYSISFASHFHSHFYFANFRTEPTEMVWTEVPQNWCVSTNNSKSTNRENPHFSVLMHRVRTSKIYLCLEDNRSSFSRVSLKSETKDARP